MSAPYDEAQVWAVLRSCFDPELPVNVVELGLIYAVKDEPLASGGRYVEIGLMLTAPGCSMSDFLKQEIETKVAALPGVGAARVEVVLDPPWDPSRMSEAARLQLGIF